MVDILKSDIFFFISSVAVVVLAILIIIIFAYVISILRDIKRVSRTARDGAEMVSADVNNVRGGLRKFIRFISDFISNLTGNHKKHYGKKTKK